jgi:hypothetical protein
MAGGRGARLRAAVHFSGMRRSAPCAPWRAALALLPSLPTTWVPGTARVARRIVSRRPWTAHRDQRAYSRRPPISLDAARRWAEA